MLTPLRAIRANCLDCMAGNAAEVRRCPLEGCPLYPFRMGHNPNVRRELSDTEREAVKTRLTAGRIAQRSKSSFSALGEGKDTTPNPKAIRASLFFLCVVSFFWGWGSFLVCVHAYYS